MSSDREKPVVTPRTMFATSVRVRPCSWRERRESFGRSTRISPFSTVTFISRSSFCATLPLGPSTFTRPGCAVTLTLSGILMVSLPMRDMVAPYQTVAISSPPRCCLRAWWSTSTPLEVERIAIPSPFMTLGMSVYFTYRRSPGLDWRRISLIAGRRPSSYLRSTFRVPCLPSSVRATSRTKPSSRRTSQIFCFTLLAGSSTSSSPARWALRIRVRRSATGSVMLICDYLRRPYPWARRRILRWTTRRTSRGRRRRLSGYAFLPRRLDDSCNFALQGAIAEADPAHLELVQERPAAAAELAARIRAHLELRLLLQALRLRHLGELRHLGRPEGHPEIAQQSAALFVALRRGHDGDVHALDLLDPVVVDLGKDDLLLDAERVVPAAVEALHRDPLEVAHARQRRAEQAVEELVHPVVAEGGHHADGLVLAQLEVRDALARAGHHRLLPGDRHHLLLGLLDQLVVRDRLAESHVDDDLLHLRHLHRVLVAELLHQGGDDLLLVGDAEPRRMIPARGRLALGGLDRLRTLLLPAALLLAAPAAGCLLRVGGRLRVGHRTFAVGVLLGLVFLLLLVVCHDRPLRLIDLRAAALRDADPLAVFQHLRP